jgi:hypothetical protein
MSTNSSHDEIKEIEMELLTIIAMVLGILLLVDVSALSKGADTRDGIGDDWSRRTIA